MLQFNVRADRTEVDFRILLHDDGGEQFQYEAGGLVGLEWTAIEAPLKDFKRRTDFQPPDAPDNGLTLKAVKGVGLLLFGNKDVTLKLRQLEICSMD
ncbi:MAG: hypothetical protein A2284_13985 [Deltaproteobacteria bacterium RIFOXYA12_FULL_61_11]|nr:MAG: hypothetical protein A2284_13985 [Deltaproteobacteria bacterium RIFOXYA12_FULL_61_11]